jgi:hypothetical protein
MNDEDTAIKQLEKLIKERINQIGLNEYLIHELNGTLDVYSA